MFKKILIANRGEIACRVIKTARNMGIKTVAVYSEADRDALHVEMADEAVAIGPPAGRRKLPVDRPDRGCLQEHRRRGRASRLRLPVRARGVSARAAEGRQSSSSVPIRTRSRAMGDKIESKKAAAKANVSTVPGHLGVIEDEKHAVKIADEIGYPVMIKASAGGGTKRPKSSFNSFRGRNLPANSTVIGLRRRAAEESVGTARISGKISS